MPSGEVHRLGKGNEDQGKGGGAVKTLPVYEYATPSGKVAHSFIRRDGRRLMGHILVSNESKVFGSGLGIYWDGATGNNCVYWGASEAYRTALRGHEWIGWRPLDTGATAKLYPAFKWTCGACGRDNFVLAADTNVRPRLAPVEVVCGHCGATFEVEEIG